MKRRWLIAAATAPMAVPQIPMKWKWRGWRLLTLDSLPEGRNFANEQYPAATLVRTARCTGRTGRKAVPLLFGRDGPPRRPRVAAPPCVLPRRVGAPSGRALPMSIIVSQPGPLGLARDDHLTK